MTRAHATSRRKNALFIPLLVTATMLASGLVDATPAAATDPPTLSDVAAKITKLTTDLNRANEQYNTANVSLGKIHDQQATLRGQVATTQRKIAAIQKQIGTYASSAYKGGQLSMLNSVVSTNSPSRFLNQLTTLDTLATKAQAPLVQLRKERATQATRNKRLRALETAADNLVRTLTTSRASFNKQLVPLKKLQSQMTPVYANNTTSATAPPGSSAAVRFAYEHLGEPYVFGAAGPSSWDCSGLTMAAYQKIGKNLDHSAHAQYAALTHVSRDDVQTGDLVFFYGFEHVGIAVSHSQVLHAPQPGESVKIADMDTMPFAGAARP